jgi:hypothetical protein
VPISLLSDSERPGGRSGTLGAEAERVALEVVETEGARDQRSVRRAGTYIYSPPLAPRMRAG